MNTVRDKIDVVPVQDQKLNHIGRKILYTAASGLLSIALLTGCDRSSAGRDPDPTTDTDNGTGNNAPVDPADEQTGGDSGTGVVDPNGSGNGGAGTDTGANNDPAKIDVDSSSTVTIETPSGSVEVPRCPGDVKPGKTWSLITPFVSRGDFVIGDATPGTTCATTGGGLPRILDLFLLVRTDDFIFYNNRRTP